MKSLALICAVGCVGFALSACGGTVYTRGQLIDDAALSAVKPGATQAEVLQALGSPSVQALLDPNVWFYFAGEQRRAARFLPRQVTSQTVLALRFSQEGVLETIDNLDPPPVGGNLMTTEVETPTRGKTISVFQRIFGNIGRFAPPAAPGG